jgi:hydrogenase/urease accessory protein HupE
VRRRFPRLALPGLLAFLTLAPLRATAHLIAARQGTLNVVDNSVFQVLSVPVSALNGFDDDGDGLLSAAEMQRHRVTLRAEIDRRYVVRDGDTDGQSKSVDLVLSPEHEARTDRAAHVVVLKRTEFARPPADLRVFCDLFGTRDEERQLTITATRPGSAGKEVESAVLSASSPEHRYFRARTAVFAEYVWTGAKRVLFGPDHLLFLLTVIVAGRRWRDWLGAITGFTVAHSIALAAAMLGHVHVSTRVVEPLIALSIVVIAAANLARREQTLRRRLILVCGFGLVHGLGFASSLESFGLDSVHRVLSLVGFNLGVELGQALFLVASLVLLSTLRRLVPRIGPAQTQWAVSALAIVIGSFWMVQRLAG